MKELVVTRGSPLLPWSNGRVPYLGLRRRREVDTMEGGGGSGNKTTGGLAGFFGAGGAGYSHADLAGVPRKYRASGVSISQGCLQLHRTWGVLFFFFLALRSVSTKW